MTEPYITLSQALKLGKTDEFALQEEARGIGPALLNAFDATLAGIVKAPLSGGRTLRSSSLDGSSGKKTRRGTGRRAAS